MDTEEVNISSDEDKEVPLIGWSREDKYSLLQALKYSDSRNIDRIRTMLPSKSTKEIADAIAHYKRKASEHPIIIERMEKVRKPIKKCSQVPLAMWAKLLTDNFSFIELNSESPSAVRLIAEFDNIPLPTSTCGVDFRAVYHAIANAMEGKSLPDDKMVNAVLEKCIIEAAYASKAFIRPTSFKNIINNINLSDTEITVFPRPTENHELATLRHIASQRRYNPLNISETYLKPSAYNNNT